MNRIAAFRWSDNERYWKGFLVDLCVQEITPILHQMGYSARVTEEKQDSRNCARSVGRGPYSCHRERKPFRPRHPHPSKAGFRQNKLQRRLGVVDPLGPRRERERWLPTLKAGVPAGKEVIPWRAIAYANLCVSLHADGKISLRRLRRCISLRDGSPDHRGLVSRTSAVELCSLWLDLPHGEASVKRQYSIGAAPQEQLCAVR